MGGFEDGGAQDDDGAGDDLNPGANARQQSSTGYSADGKAAAGRSADERAQTAQLREARQPQVDSGQQPPTADSPYDSVHAAVNIDHDYDQVGDEFENPEGAANTTQAIEAVNNVEAGLVADAPDAGVEAYLQAVQASRDASQLEVENAESNSDQKRAREAKARRKKFYAALVGFGVVGLISVIACAATGQFDSDDGSGGSGGGGSGGGSDGPDTEPFSETNLDASAPVTIDVPTQVAKAGKTPIDKTSVKLVDHDDGDETVFTIDKVGTFKLDQASGVVTFTPLATFQGGKAMINVTIADTSGNRSKPAMISLSFKEKAAPDVQNVTKSGINPSKVFEIDVPSEIVAKHANPIDNASVQLIGHVKGNANLVDVFQRGQFTLDPATGKVRFSPLAYFIGGMSARVGVSIADTAGKRSAQATITLEFDQRPGVADQIIQADLSQINAVTFNPVTGTGVTRGMAATKGTYDIDPSTVVFLMPMPLEMGDPQRGRISVTGGKTAKAENEGTWSIDNAGTITFTPESGFTGSPTPMTYQLFDTKGIPSNVGSLTITSYLDQLEAQIKKINAMDDAAFWTFFEQSVINSPDWGSLNNPGESAAKLILFREILNTVDLVTRKGFAAGAFDPVFAARSDATSRTPEFLAWVQAGFSVDALYSHATALADKNTSATIKNTTLGERFNRIWVMKRFIALWDQLVNGT